MKQSDNPLNALIRRQFLKRLGIIGTGTLLSPSLMLGGCGKDDEDNPQPNSDLTPINFSGTVAIIGAGAAGLQAASILKKRGVTVKIFEASATYGGRIRPLTGFSDFTIELGAEVIHGNKSVWYRMVKDAGISLIDDSTLNELYWYDNTVINERQIKSKNGYDALTEAIDAFEKEPAPDQTVEAFLRSRGVNPKWDKIANARTGNEFGTDITRLATQNHGQTLWTAGDGDYLLKNGHGLQVLEKNFNNVINQDLLLNTPIKAIDYTGAKIKLTDNQNRTHEADRIIITVPITVLQSGSITFTPALPEAKTTALRKIGMDAGLKIIMMFNKQLWDDDLGSIIGSENVPEYWTTAPAGRSVNNNILTAFVCGQYAEALSALSEQEAVKRCLVDLDKVFNNQATAALTKSYVMDWTKQPYINGTYSYPKVGAAGAVQALASAIENRIFFAGEATNTNGHIATIHGALETGIRAASEVANSIK